MVFRNKTTGKHIRSLWRASKQFRTLCFLQILDIISAPIFSHSQTDNIRPIPSTT